MGGGRARAKKNGRCTNTRKETRRKTGNQVERLISCEIYMESVGLMLDGVLDLTSGREKFKTIAVTPR